MNKNQKGFSPVWIVLIILVLAGTSFAAWRVWENKNTPNEAVHNNSPDSTTPQESSKAEDLYEGWKTYDDENISFKHPETWTIYRDQNNPTKHVSIKSPNDGEIRLLDAATKQIKKFDNQRLELGVVVNPSFHAGENHRCSSRSGSPESCKIYDITRLSNINLPNAKLITSDFNGGSGFPILISIIDDSEANIGMTDYRSSYKIDGKFISIAANVQFGPEPMSFGWIANIDDFKKTSSFQDMVKILESLVIK